MTPLEFLLSALATVRLTRLVVLDTLWEGTRDRVLEWADRPGRARLARAKLGELLGCPHCVGVWAAALVVATFETAPAAWWRIGVTVAALAGVTSLLAEIGDRVD